MTARQENSCSDNNDIQMSKLLKLAQNFNCFYLKGLNLGECKPFIIEGHQVGLIKPEVLKMLLQFPEVFRVNSGYVELNPAFRDYEERSYQVDVVLRKLREKNVLIALKGWRDECYEVTKEYGAKSFLKMDRSATCLFGIRQYSVYINGYVKHPNLGICTWLQQRSATKQTWPNKWDIMVGGGLSVGHSLMETAFKEAKEEASIPPELLKNLTSCGTVSFYFESERGLFPDTEFVFDLELPVEFTPSNADGEVQKFELLTFNEYYEKMFSPDFKTTSIPVVIDFMVRHGLIGPETEPCYPQILELLHVPLQRIYNIRTSQENGQVDEK